MSVRSANASAIGYTCLVRKEAHLLPSLTDQADVARHLLQRLEKAAEQPSAAKHRHETVLAALD